MAGGSSQPSRLPQSTQPPSLPRAPAYTQNVKSPWSHSMVSYCPWSIVHGPLSGAWSKCGPFIFYRYRIVSYHIISYHIMSILLRLATTCDRLACHALSTPTLTPHAVAVALTESDSLPTSTTTLDLVHPPSVHRFIGPGVADQLAAAHVSA